MGDRDAYSSGDEKVSKNNAASDLQFKLIYFDAN